MQYSYSAQHYYEYNNFPYSITRQDITFIVALTLCDSLYKSYTSHIQVYNSINLLVFIKDCLTNTGTVF